MQTIRTIEGHEARVVDESDLLQAERQMKFWLVGIIGAILAAGLIVGRSYASIDERTTRNAERIEEIRAEGSIPLQVVKSDIAVIREQLRANTERQIEILDALSRMERRAK